MAKNDDALVTVLQQLVAKAPDKDSFATFTDGFLKGWPLVLALIGSGYFVVTNFSAVNSINTTQQLQIDRNSEAIEAMTDKIDITNDNSIEIVRRLDALQKDIEVIKDAR